MHIRGNIFLLQKKKCMVHILPNLHRTPIPKINYEMLLFNLTQSFRKCWLLPISPTTNRCTTSSNHKQVHHKKQPQTSAPQVATKNKCTTSSNHKQVHLKQQPQTGASQTVTTHRCTTSSNHKQVQVHHTQQLQTFAHETATTRKCNSKNNHAEAPWKP